MKKLAIVGSGSGTRHLAPFDDLSFDIWVFNEAANSEWCKRWDACFQMHKPEIFSGHNTKDRNHYDWLLSEHEGKKIYMQAYYNYVPACHAYNLSASSDLIGMDYFTSTFAYMAAQAVRDDYKQIDVYGVEMSFSEYQYQAEGFRFWIGYLMGAGITVNMHSGRKLFEAPLYGYEGNFTFGADYFAGRAAELLREWEAAVARVGKLKANIERAVSRLEFDYVVKLTTEYQNAALECGELAGSLAEAERYQKFGDRYADRGGFEFAAARAQAKAEEKRILMYHTGGKIEYVWNIWSQTKRADAASQMMQLIGTMGGYAEETGALLGMYHENCKYMLEYDGMVRANGGIKELA